jgi:micrococcal nuclease
MFISRKAPHGALFVLWQAVLLGGVLALALPPAVQAHSEVASVRHVLDGDTVILSDERSVRLIGINAPELGHDGAPDDPFAVAARDRLRKLVQGSRVRLDFEDEHRDRYGRWLAHLWLADGRSAEEILVAEGLASVVAIPPNVRDTVRLLAAETVARRARLGLWGHTYSVPIDVDRRIPEPGFRFVRGHVTRVGKSHKYIYLDLGTRFALRIRHQDWDRHFQGRPESWRGSLLVARGWVSERDGRSRIAIGHPAMIERLP